MTNSVASVGSASQTSSTTTGASQPASLSQVDTSAFMQLLLTELKHQNPLEPMKDSDMMAQMTQLNSLSELQTIRSQMSNMVISNEFIYATSLIGKSVTATIGKGETVNGVVTGLTQENGVVMLHIGEKEVAMSSVTEVGGNNP